MDLVPAIAAAMREHDPLEPWLTESHWDEHHWDNEAGEVARRLRPGMAPDDVRTVITAVLRESLPETFADDGDDRQTRRIDDMAAAVWQIAQTA